MISKIWQERMEDETLLSSDDINHLSAITMLKKICNHPVLIQSNRIEDHIDVGIILKRNLQNKTVNKI